MSKITKFNYVNTGGTVKETLLLRPYQQSRPLQQSNFQFTYSSYIAHTYIKYNVHTYQCVIILFIQYVALNAYLVFDQLSVKATHKKN